MLESRSTATKGYKVKVNSVFNPGVPPGIQLRDSDMQRRWARRWISTLDRRQRTGVDTVTLASGHNVGLASLGS